MHWRVHKPLCAKTSGSVLGTATRKDTEAKETAPTPAPIALDCSGNIAVKRICYCAYDEIPRNCCEYCDPPGTSSRAKHVDANGTVYYTCGACNLVIGQKYKCSEPGCDHFIAQDQTKDGKRYCACCSPWNCGLDTPVRNTYRNDSTLEQRCIQNAHIPDDDEMRESYSGFGPRERSAVRQGIRLAVLARKQPWSRWNIKTITMQANNQKRAVLTTQAIQANTGLPSCVGVLVASYFCDGFAGHVLDAIENLGYVSFAKRYASTHAGNISNGPANLVQYHGTPEYIPLRTVKTYIKTISTTMQPVWGEGGLSVIVSAYLGYALPPQKIPVDMLAQCTVCGAMFIRHRNVFRQRRKRTQHCKSCKQQNRPID